MILFRNTKLRLARIKLAGLEAELVETRAFEIRVSKAWGDVTCSLVRRIAETKQEIEELS
jgi:hypothetical protein